MCLRDGSSLIQSCMHCCCGHWSADLILECLYHPECNWFLVGLGPGLMRSPVHKTSWTGTRLQIMGVARWVTYLLSQAFQATAACQVYPSFSRIPLSPEDQDLLTASWLAECTSSLRWSAQHAWHRSSFTSSDRVQDTQTIQAHARRLGNARLPMQWPCQLRFGRSNSECNGLRRSLVGQLRKTKLKTCMDQR